MTNIRSSQEDDELNFSHSEFLTEIDATEQNNMQQKSEPTNHHKQPKSSSGAANEVLT